MTKKRIQEYLAEGKRFDGRKPEEFRDISAEFGVSINAEGSARIRMGKTEVLVGVKMNLGEPYPDSPNKGNLSVTAELLPLSSPRFELGPPKINSIELARVTDRMVRESKIIDFEKLCIKEGEKVWTIFVDVYSINDDGNLLDAAGLGAIIALKNAKIPKYDEKTGKVLYGDLTDQNVPLTKEVPLSVTVHKIGNNFLVDPTREEEDVSETRISVGSSNGNISSMQKGELQTVTPEEFGKILDLVDNVWKDLYKKVEKFLK